MSQVLEAHKRRVGQRIRFARVSAHLSHDALAAKVGTSRQHLIKLEKGQHLPRPEMLAAIARETGKDESYFDSDDDEESDPLPFGQALQLMFERAVDDAVDRRLRDRAEVLS